MTEPALTVAALIRDQRMLAACGRWLEGSRARLEPVDLSGDPVQALEQRRDAFDALLLQPPVNGLQAKFNMAYCMSAALLDGAIRLASFDDTQVMRPEIRAWLPRVTLQEAPGTILPRWSQVRIECANGRVLAQRINTARGDAGDPLSDAELIEKAVDCFAFGNLGADADVFARQVFELPTRDVDDVICLLHASK